MKINRGKKKKKIDVLTKTIIFLEGCCQRIVSILGNQRHRSRSIRDSVLIFFLFSPFLFPFIPRMNTPQIEDRYVHDEGFTVAKYIHNGG
jgi:hypothetical protein